MDFEVPETEIELFDEKERRQKRIKQKQKKVNTKSEYKRRRSEKGRNYFRKNLATELDIDKIMMRENELYTEVEG